MKSSTIIVAIVAFFLGISVHAWLELIGCSIGHVIDPQPRTIDDHFDVIERARWQVEHPEETNELADVESSLAALVAANELEYVDLVVPKVAATREATRYWMNWANGQEDVLWMTGNPQYAYYQPEGEQPLHIQIWFRESARSAVQHLIMELEAMSDVPNRADTGRE